MTTEVTDEFTASLSELPVEWTRIETGAFEATLAEVVTPPVVGSELPFEGVSLAALDDPEVTREPTLAELRAAHTGVTAAELGVADYGSVLLRSDRTPLTEPASLFVEEHVAVLAESDLHPDMGAALDDLGPTLREEGASAVLATGPSATADMGELVLGAHGPETVHVVVLTDR